jgi:GNAT superfamily N-acetyltransferase
LGEKIYRLQSATAGDAEFLYRVYAGTRTLEMALTGWGREKTGQFLRSQFQLQDTHYHRYYSNPFFYIIYNGRRRMGRLYINRGKEEMRIIDISLLPEYREKGIGTCILKDIIKESEAAGLPVSLHIEPANPARRLYEKLGFIVTGEVGGRYFMERTVRAATVGAEAIKK